MKIHARWIGLRGSRPVTWRGLIGAVGLVLAVLPIGCSQGCNQNQYHATAAAGTPMVRVLVRENAPQVAISATEPPTIRVGPGAAQTINLARGASVNLILTGAGWKIGS